MSFFSPQHKRSLNIPKRVVVSKLKKAEGRWNFLRGEPGANVKTVCGKVIDILWSNEEN